MKALKIVGFVLIGILALAFAFVLIQPSKGHVEKSIVINAPASAIFPHLNNLKSFTAWSPWSKMDPEAKQTFEGPEAGVGAKMNWDGEIMGKGSQWVEESVENERVKTGLSFEGMEGKIWAEFKLSPEGNGTKVIWTYDGENIGLGGKAMWATMGMMLGGQYEDGLKDLKQLVENSPATEPSEEMAPADSTSSN
jgi:hypothetical protein